MIIKAYYPFVEWNKKLVVKNMILNKAKRRKKVSVKLFLNGSYKKIKYLYLKLIFDFIINIQYQKLRY